MIRSEWNLWLVALTFYTRIAWLQPNHYDSQLLPVSNRYLPLVGALVGVISGLVGVLVAHWLPVSVAAWCLVFASIAVTGAFHEDGLADTFDSLGAWSLEKRLAIMKDSRIGTFGSCALIATIGLRALLWQTLPVTFWLPAAVVVHSLSRLLPLFLVRSLAYVREDQTSKVKPVAQSIAGGDLLRASGFALVFSVSVLMLAEWSVLFLLLVALLLLFLCLRFWFGRLFGGYTGDQLGAAQQMSEWVILAVLVGAVV